MSADRLQGWITSSKAQYLQARLKMGETDAIAQGNAERSYAAYFPDGKPVTHHVVFDVLDQEDPVGYLWIGPQLFDQLTAWWVWDVEIHESARGRGFGRAAMTLAEEHVRAAGGHTLGLNVFGFNTVARGLYESLGYETMALQMRKNIEATG